MKSNLICDVKIKNHDNFTKNFDSFIRYLGISNMNFEIFIHF